MDDIKEETNDNLEEERNLEEKKNEEEKENAGRGIGMKTFSFQSVVKKLVQAHTSLDKIDVQPLNKRVLYPSDPDAARQRVPVNGGSLITEDVALRLRASAFGPPDIVSFTSMDWLDCPFELHKEGTSKAWALRVVKEGTKGLVMAVQAYFIKHLLFCRRRTRGTTDIKILMRPDRKTQEECLASALSDILWKAGDKQRAVLCLQNNKEVLEDTEFFRGDGVTEKIQILHFKKQDDLTFNIKKYLYQFLADEKHEGSGLVQMLYSVILTKGFDKFRVEMDVDDPAAVQSNGTLHRSVANLMLTGRGSPYLHNGIIYEGTEATMARPKTGTLLRSEIGFLLWEGTGSKPRAQVGSRLKTPTYPIWVTLCGDKYGVLFNPNKDLMRDYHAENRFDLLYYSGEESRQCPTTLTIDTREPKYLDVFNSPHLELLIQTKWEDASVEWNGEVPYF